MSYPEDREFHEIIPPTEPRESDSAPLTPLDPASFERYTPLMVESMGVVAYKDDIDSMYKFYKQHSESTAPTVMMRTARAITVAMQSGTHT